MASENFLTFIESDTPARLSRTSSRVTWTDMLSGDDNIHVSLDKGVDFFDGSFVHTLTIEQTASEKAVAYSGFWALTNDLDDLKGLRDASKDALYIQASHPNSPDRSRLHLVEIDGGSAFGDGSGGYSPLGNGIDGTTLYLTITRDETVGSFGEIKMQAYTDAERTTLVNTQSFNLHTSKKDFRYVMVGVSEDSTFGTGADAKKSSGYSENLNLLEFDGSSSGGATPQVSTQGMSDIAAETATGNGTIINLGLTSVTAHGHVWKTVAAFLADQLEPVTSDSSVDNGAGSLGPFTSAITGLTSGITYISRAFATNSHGTTYGIGASWKAGATYSAKVPGVLGIKGTELRYVGMDGAEYAVQGTAV